MGDYLIMSISSEELQKYIDVLNENVNEFSSITDKVVKEQSADLDELMEAIKYSVTQEDAISTDAIERYYAELSNLVYFMSDRIGRLSVFKDMSKAMTKEAYNNAYLKYSMEKDEKGKSVRTVNENSALSETETKTQSVVDTIYANAYNILKNKLDVANEMVSTLKHMLRRRVSEEYLNAQVSTNRAELRGEEEF